MKYPIGREDYLIFKQTDFNKAVASLHSKAARLMSSTQVERCVSPGLPEVTMYKGWWLAVESLSYRYRFYVDNLLAGVLFVLLRRQNKDLLSLPSVPTLRVFRIYLHLCCLLI